MIASIAISGLLGVLIQLIIAGLILYLLFWLVGYVGLPEPFAKVARAVLACVVVIYLINLLLGLSGYPLFTLR